MDGIKMAWWHRLMLVLLVLWTLLFGVLACAVVYETSKQRVLFYSWHGGGIPAEKLDQASVCDAGSADGYVTGYVFSCGDFDSVTSLANDLVRHGVVVTGSNVDTPELSLAKFIDSQRLKAYDRYEFAPKKAVLHGFYALMATLAAFYAGALLFKLALWIVHGRTDFAK